MSNIEKHSVDTLMVGDPIMLKSSNDVYVGEVSQMIFENRSMSLVTVKNLRTDDGKTLPEMYVPIKEGSLYKADRIDEGVRMMDGTEPMVNGIFIADIDLNELQKRNRQVDEQTEEYFEKAKELIHEPIRLEDKEEPLEVDDANEEEALEVEDEEVIDEKEVIQLLDSPLKIK